MARLFSIVFALLVSSAAHGSILELTGSTLSIDLPAGFVPPAVVAQGVDPVPIFVSSGSGGFVLPPGVFAGSAFLPLPSLSTSLSFVGGNQTASFGAGGGIGGGFGGPGALTGIHRVGVLGGLLNLSVPMSPVGVPGVVMGGAASLMITVTGHLWTTGVAVATDGTGPPVTATGFDNRTVGHRGDLTLVTPIRVISNATNLGDGFATLTLRFVPEPGNLVLLAVAFAGVVLGSRRLGKRPR